MKICGISDLHGNLIDNISECDILCIAGDIIPVNIQLDSTKSKEWWLNDFCNWVKALPCKKVIFTAGNHDFFIEELYKKGGDYYEFVAKLEQNSNDKAILLINEMYTYNGIHFYGFPYVKTINFQKWAFESDNVEDYKVLKREDIDILIIHDTPIRNTYINNILESICNKPIVFCGHWHEEKTDTTQGIYNCSILTNTYRIKKDFTIPTINIDTEESKIEQMFSIMINNIPMYTALKGYDNFQVNAIKEYLELNRDFFLRQKEDSIPLPVTGEVIDEQDED